jgi:hypothetical protein
MITITGAASSPGYLVTTWPLNVTGGLIKLSFQCNTSGANLALFAGTEANLTSQSGGIGLCGSSGATFLAIVDAKVLNGQLLFVRPEVGRPGRPLIPEPWNFTLIID